MMSLPLPSLWNEEQILAMEAEVAECERAHAEYMDREAVFNKYGLGHFPWHELPCDDIPF